MKKKLLLLGASILSSVGAFASSAPAVTVPTPDYTTFYEVVGVGLAVTLIVGLARKSKSFLK